MRTMHLLTYMPVMLAVPAMAIAHDSGASAAMHIIEHAAWLLPILLIGLAPLPLRRRG